MYFYEDQSLNNNGYFFLSIANLSTESTVKCMRCSLTNRHLPIDKHLPFFILKKTKQSAHQRDTSTDCCSRLPAASMIWEEIYCRYFCGYDDNLIEDYSIFFCF